MEGQRERGVERKKGETCLTETHLALVDALIRRPVRRYWTTAINGHTSRVKRAPLVCSRSVPFFLFASAHPPPLSPGPYSLSSRARGRDLPDVTRAIFRG